MKQHEASRATGNQSALFAPQDPLLQVLVCAHDELLSHCERSPCGEVNTWALRTGQG